MKNFLLACLAIVWSGFSLCAQSPWEKLDAVAYPPGERRITPLAFEAYQLDTTLLKQRLWAAPHEREVDVRYSPTILELPTPDGEVAVFRIVAYDMMEPLLAARFPGIRTWRGVDKRDHRRTIHLDWTERGFHAAVRGAGADWFIDPYLWSDKRYYQTYYTHNTPAPEEPFVCHVDEIIQPEAEPIDAEKAGDCRFRSYRTAIATTGEYSTYHGGTEALVHSAVTTTLNRVNGVYAADLAIRLVLVGNNPSLYYYDGATDPYTNGSGSAMLDENQTNINLVIGSANYDMGHVFSTGGGGIAQLQSPCGSGKARGVTGRGAPTGDAFDIDYVAHEMGHQFGANHTQNNSCNYSSVSGMEPGSASTIMGYAGICSPNIQNNSDAYYHGISLQQIANYMESGSGSTCATTVSTANGNPTITAGLDYTIPISTPFVLSASAADPNGHALTYCWEQWDPEQGTQAPVSTNILGPMFRSFSPTSSPQRYFPELEAIVNGTNPTWEELPSVGRSMEFRVSVRDWDNTNGYGCTIEDNIDLTVSDQAGPFVVTSPNTATSLTSGSSVQVTWDVAGTDVSPINCDNVDILLSTDNGYTYNISLATSVPNNGAAYIVVPNNLTTQARVMVRCSDNVFFDISNVNFAIVAGSPTYSLSPSPAIKTICDNVDTDQYTVAVNSFLGYSDAVSLSIQGSLPGSAMASFSPASVMPGSSSTLSFTNLNSVAVGSYNITIRGVSTTGTKDVNVTLNVVEAPTTPVTTSPSNGAIDQTPSVTLSWQPSSNATEYALEVSTSAAFGSTFLSTTLSLTTTTVSGLSDQTTYYWRVRGVGSCNSDWATASFTTAPCFTYSSTDVPKSISGGNPSFITSVLPITAGGTIIDLDVVNVVGTHTWVGDLLFTLISPSNTSRVLISNVCSSNDNFNFQVDDSSVLVAGGSNCPINSGLTYSPTQALSTYQSSAVAGTWTLQVNDTEAGDGGQLSSWGLRVCLANYSPLPVDWLYFDARPANDHALLSWATAMEYNNLGFEIERHTAQNTNWKPIAFVEGQGDTDRVSRYEYEDLTAHPGHTYYYRLRQIDVDGRDSYSGIRSVNLAKPTSGLRVFPNPASDKLWVDLGPLAEGGSYRLTDTYGRLYARGVLSVPTTEIALNDLPPGTYWLQVFTADEQAPQTIRFVHTGNQ